MYCVCRRSGRIAGRGGRRLRPDGHHLRENRQNPFSIPGCRKNLLEQVRVFERLGGRGVELADDIDKLRTIIAIIPLLKPLKKKAVARAG
jgi:hypothetical protein